MNVYKCFICRVNLVALGPCFLSSSPLSEKSPDEYVSNARARKIN